MDNDIFPGVVVTLTVAFIIWGTWLITNDVTQATIVHSCKYYSKFEYNGKFYNCVPVKTNESN